MLRLSELKLPLDHSEADLQLAICRRLRIPPGQLLQHRLVKRSVDARRRAAIALVYSLDLVLDLDARAEQRLLQRFCGDPHLRPTPDTTYRFPLEPLRAERSDSGAAAPEASALGRRPLVVGAGPCGYFAALLLAQMGLRPLLLERGRPVKQRTADTFGFWRGQRPFDPESNAQFGEGGAGTFSDGKLYSQVSEPQAYVRKVLEELVAAGANPEILTLHHPHIGTFKLATVVRGLRARIEALGGEVRFEARVEELLLEGADRRVRGVRLAGGETIAADQVVLALGHSARDTFAALHRQGVVMAPKPFAIGLRIEHPQPLIDRARWGEAAGHPRLGPAEYKLVHHCAGPTTTGRSVYSFCMCPGGLVVGATSEPGCVVTNGMSQHSRNERNANSGLVVTVEPADLAPYGTSPDDPLAGVAFQRHWEERAFRAGGGDYRAPAQWVGDFLAGQTSQAAPQQTGPGDPSASPPSVAASYLPGVRLGSLESCLPPVVLDALREALPAFERRLPGYTMAGALLTGVETRTSSPLRIPRDPLSRESLNTPGLYPAGEGAGYAGGILSAAIDGIQVAEAVALSRLSGPPDSD
ncbi:FAD-dependent oxidoreductase [Synechococcus sp. CBW1002]|uniref:NAD(P)/FAD-dependent oxidoreductase n=1 Tax=Synechococcus sp. CBW1002 TaxID=1353134 RepID=UPI0018CD246E|nr:FAD-dependent oxidoreductase [Synechococcus sp. CBW1002]QPN59984.1 FAD-dependent oxidoreductase [Synechococcus sp. CBW1002]